MSRPARARTDSGADLKGSERTRDERHAIDLPRLWHSSSSPPLSDQRQRQLSSFTLALRNQSKLSLLCNQSEATIKECYLMGESDGSDGIERGR